MCEVERLYKKLYLMPQYLTTKKVWALKIEKMIYENGSVVITSTEVGYAPFLTSFQLVQQYSPSINDYYVVEEDGNECFISAEIFESKYSRI